MTSMPSGSNNLHSTTTGIHVSSPPTPPTINTPVPSSSPNSRSTPVHSSSNSKISTPESTTPTSTQSSSMNSSPYTSPDNISHHYNLSGIKLIVDLDSAKASYSTPIPPSSSPLPYDPQPMVLRNKKLVSRPNALTCVVDQITVPTSFSAAKKIPQWRKAMLDEFNALLANQTWCLVPPSPHMNIVGCKWIF